MVEVLPVPRRQGETAFQGSGGDDRIWQAELELAGYTPSAFGTLVDSV